MGLEWATISALTVIFVGSLLTHRSLPEKVSYESIERRHREGMKQPHVILLGLPTKKLRAKADRTYVGRNQDYIFR